MAASTLASVPALGAHRTCRAEWKLPPAARDRAEEFGDRPGLTASVTLGIHVSTHTLSSECSGLQSIIESSESIWGLKGESLKVQDSCYENKWLDRKELRENPKILRFEPSAVN